MKIDLSGRTALITGSTSGIGLATATGLARAGARVVVNGRDEKRTEEAADMVAEAADAHGRVSAVAADVGTAAGCDALIAAEPDVDILVNNAGIFEPVPVFEIADEEWQQMFEVNVLSGIRLSRHHIPQMVGRGWGRVLFVSSESAIQIPNEMVHYGTSKTAQLAVSRGMAESVAGSGVTVNAILPGPTLTGGVREMLSAKMAEEGIDDIAEAGRRFIAERRPSSILERLIEPEEVANLAVYLSSPLASATTGSAVRVDGGVVRAAFG